MFYKIGGPARYFFEAKNIDVLIDAVEGWRRFYSDGRIRIVEDQRPAVRYSDTIFVVGDATNILFDDNGFEGLIFKPNIKTFETASDILRVGAGVPINEILDCSIAKGLSGMEWAGGLPGTLGGAIYGNAGCFGGEIKDNIREVLSLDISSSKPKIVRRANRECDFSYRSSIFKKNKRGEIILEATLFFKKGDKKMIRAAIEEKINYRRECQPLEYPNIGSIFKNVDLEKVPKKLHKEFIHVIKTDPFPVIPTAHLIHEVGLKGISFGGAMISLKHPNFIVNALNASAEDVKKLIALIKNKVKEKFLIDLEEEIIQL